MSIEPLNERVVQLWNDPDSMIKDWGASENKLEHERLIANWVDAIIRHEGPLADLGCGVGRMVESLTTLPRLYHGFDGSSAMIDRAKSMHSDHSFAVTDIFNYVGNRQYETAILLDVVQHQNDPIGSILRIMDLWNAERYIVSLLVGDGYEELHMSVVVPLSDLLGLLDQVDLQRMYMERCGVEKFSWVLLDLERQDK